MIPVETDPGFILLSMKTGIKYKQGVVVSMNLGLATKTMLATTVSVFFATADAATLLAFYEISAEVNGNRSLIRTSKPIEFGSPVTHEFGEYQLSMIFEPGEPDSFKLTASLNAISPSTNSVVYTILNESFDGQISTANNFGQSEYTIEENGISISIVLRLSQIREQ